MFKQVPLVYFCFYLLYSRRWVTEDLAVIYVIECSAYVFLYEFLVSGLMFRSLIHFEFIFVYAVMKRSNFILLHIAVQFSQCHLLKRLSFPHCIFLPHLSKIRCPQVHGFISGLSVLFHWSVFLFFLPLPYCLDCCSFIVQSEVRKVDSSGSIFLSQDCCGYSESFFFHTN